MNVIEHEPDNIYRPYVVYWVSGIKHFWRTAFSTREAAEIWVVLYGDHEAVEVRP